MQDFINIVQGVGFPIACCIALFIMLQNQRTTEAVNNNTMVMQRLVDMLEGDKK